MTGQPFLPALTDWHPRDVDTAWWLLHQQQRAQEEAARDARFEQARRQLLQKGW